MCKSGRIVVAICISIHAISRASIAETECSHQLEAIVLLCHGYAVGSNERIEMALTRLAKREETNDVCKVVRLIVRSEADIRLREKPVASDALDDLVRLPVVDDTAVRLRNEYLCKWLAGARSKIGFDATRQAARRIASLAASEKNIDVAICGVEIMIGYGDSELAVQDMLGKLVACDGCSDEARRGIDAKVNLARARLAMSRMQVKVLADCLMKAVEHETEDARVSELVCSLVKVVLWHHERPNTSKADILNQLPVDWLKQKIHARAPGFDGECGRAMLRICTENPADKQAEKPVGTP